MAGRRYTARDFELTPEEKEAARIAGEGGAAATGVGSAVGGLAGGALGALLGLVPGAGAVLGPAGLAAGSSIGSQLGGALGAKTAEGGLQGAEDVLARGEAKRQRALRIQEMQQRALSSLLARG